MKISRYAMIFPDMEPEEYEKLKEDIKEHGLLEPIVVKDGEIIDGKHRYRACMELGIEPKFVELPDGISPLEYVIAKNLHRRHLTKDQRAVIAQEILPLLEEEARHRSMANLKPFKSAQSSEVPNLAPLGKSRDIAGKMLDVGHTYVSMAKAVLKKAPELREPIMKGQLKLLEAKRIAELPEEKRRIVLEKKLEDPKRDVRVIIREINNREKLERTPPMPEGKYQVIYADPPWKFEFSSSEPRTVENHYPTMELEEIKALKVPAAGGCTQHTRAHACRTPQGLSPDCRP
ncbi:MAG: ParB N-terminal domain-containing protein [Nitrososphaeria archaeon]